MKYRTNKNQQYDQYDLIDRLMAGNSLSRMTVSMKNDANANWDYRSRISYEVNPNMDRLPF